MGYTTNNKFIDYVNCKGVVLLLKPESGPKGLLWSSYISKPENFRLRPNSPGVQARHDGFYIAWTNSLLISFKKKKKLVNQKKKRKKGKTSFTFILVHSLSVRYFGESRKPIVWWIEFETFRFMSCLKLMNLPSG